MKFRAFKAYRPATDKVHLVASRSYITYSKKDLTQKLESNPFSFLHVINPDFNATKKLQGKAKLKAIRNKFEEFINEHFLIQDQHKSFYLYKQIKEGFSCRGLIGCSSAKDYQDGKIKIHESTLTVRERKLKEYTDVVKIHAEPVCLTHDNNLDLDKILDQTESTKPIYDFSTTDNVRHILWKIDNEATLKQIENIYSEQIKTSYIADGHHRSASSLLYSIENNHLAEDNNAHFFMSICVPKNQLKIFDYNRVVKSLNQLSDDEFLNRLKENFIVEKLPDNNQKPKQVHQIILKLKTGDYLLLPKAEIIEKNNPVKRLDAQILTDYILSPILDIKDLKNHPDISFVNGTEPLEKYNSLIKKGKAKAAFILYPATLEDIKSVADNNLHMPPKTTWVEPKLRSGLTIFDLETS